MTRDERLPTILRKAQIARIEDDRLLIGDRRRYPTELTNIACDSVREIADAIRAMVTQGGGPLQVSLTTMRLLARRIHAGKENSSLKLFVDAARELSDSRPTNTTMARTMQEFVSQVSTWYTCNQVRDVHGDDLITFVDDIIDRLEQRFDQDYELMSDIGSSLIQDADGILTTCFAEHSFILSLVKAREQGKHLTVYVPETRPYLQGARLTAPALTELGIDCVLVTDGMGAHLMSAGKIHRYMTAADLVAMDGTVVNKIGTLANAIAAKYYHIPYHVFSMSPDASKLSKDDIIMEERNGDAIRYYHGVEVTPASIKALYPAFDMIEPSLVDTIITPRGAVAPTEIDRLYRFSTSFDGGLS